VKAPTIGGAPGDRTGLRRNRIAHRTSQLPATSRILYRIEHYTSFPAIAIGIIGAMLAMIAAGAALGFPSGWVAAFEVSASGVTLIMVFAIQHTQGREQAATQRKLDELLRALPGADESLMMLEEAPPQVMLDVEEEQRDVRSASPDTEAEQQPHERPKAPARLIVIEDHCTPSGIPDRHP